MAEECTICYERCHQDDFFILNCCHEKKMCHGCLESLRMPLCPFCRRVIPEIKEDPKYRMATSLPETSSFLFMHYSHHHHNHNDNQLFQSRILRRRMKRLRKLELREEDRLRNQYRW